jgi:hypothetical protein
MMPADACTGVSIVPNQDLPRARDTRRVEGRPVVDLALAGEFPMRLNNSLFGAKNSLFRAEQGSVRSTLILRGETAASPPK